MSASPSLFFEAASCGRKVIIIAGATSRTSGWLTTVCPEVSRFDEAFPIHRLDSYRRSDDDRHVTLNLILAPVDAIIGQSVNEEPNRIVVSVRIRRLPAITTSVAAFREVTFDLREPLGTRAVVDADGNVVRQTLRSAGEGP